MRQDLGKLLQQGLIQGKGARAIAKDLKKYWYGNDPKTGGGAKYCMERLMRTELARVQTEAQKQSFVRNGFEYYEFICNHNGSTCPICRGLNGKHFKVEKMMPGDNAPPMHPNCRCSTAAWEDDEEYEAWLDYLDKGGTTEEWNRLTGMQRTIDGVYSVDARYSSEEGYLEWRKANMPILKENGIKSNVTAKEEWVKTRMQSQQHSFHVVSKEDAIKTISDSIPDQTMRAWFVSADSDAKPKILEAIMQKDDVWNAGLNVSWMNYVETTVKDISFEEFLTTPIKMYRGTRGQSEITSDVWVSFSFDKKIAESFGDQIEEITIRPIDTWGSYQTTAEGELLVPRMWLMKHRMK
jgi:SPP1 gp7 family putative phage head morphogenesis protein